MRSFICRARRACETSRAGSRVVPVALFVAAGTATVIGCGWDGIYHSVRFNTYHTQDEREFQRLPPLAENTRGINAPAASEEDYDYEAEQAQVDKLDEMWQQADAAQEKGEFEKTRQLLREYLNGTLLIHETWSASPPQLRRNSALDRLDALTALGEGTPPAALQSYLSARRAYDEGAPKNTRMYYYGNQPAQPDKPQPTVEEIQQQLDAIPTDAHLKDNVEYLRAALLYRGQKFDEAASAFKALLTKYPGSEKREAALFMAALSSYKGSDSFNSAGATMDKPCAECRDEAWQAAHDLFERLLREHPRGQYAADARGWLAHLSLRVGDNADGLAEYYRMLADENNRNARVEALISLKLTRAHASEEDVRQLEAKLADEPSAALAYAYHNIYNYTYSYYLALPEKKDGAESVGNSGAEYYGASPENFRDEQERQKTRSAAEQHELEHILTFATNMLHKFPRSGITGAFALRVAEGNLELNQPREAAEFARRALALSLKGTERDDALWVKGSAEYRLHQYDAARGTLRLLVAAEGTQGRLTEGARRLIALIAEDAGDLDGALEQYLALDYSVDVAYFIDVLMTPDQLAAFIARHRDSDKLGELNYALGVRYMRAERWHEARAAYAGIRSTQQSDYFHDYDYGSLCGLQTSYKNYNCGNPKNPFGEMEETAGVRARWVLRDLQTVNDLESLKNAVALAEGDEAKAEALYQLASYIYSSGDYLFYNEDAWSGGRYLNLSSLDEYHKYRVPNEAQLLWQYMQEHETPARALVIYLQIVELYPNTRAARDAFYTAAVCHDRLSGFNPYWRNIYAMGLHAGQRMVTYADVKAKYPDYKLPRGTVGWEPATRTVNGGPGWAVPPKPAPRPTRRERIQHYLSLGYAWAVAFWEQKLRHWLTIGLILCGLFVVWRRAARHRRSLRFKLARRRLRQPAETDATEATEETPTWRALNESEEEERSDFRVRARRVIRVALRRAGELALDARLRPALAANAVSHGLLFALLLTLGWMFYGR
ncbi:MAG TPA: outer membrane protein assembly factor BamD [Pyrinomonadaceae bacterium]